jgi:hypothetical protein
MKTFWVYLHTNDVPVALQWFKKRKNHTVIKHAHYDMDSDYSMILVQTNAKNLGAILNKTISFNYLGVVDVTEKTINL